MGERVAARFKQVEISRAIRALQAAGVRVGGVEIDVNGKIRILSESAAPTKAGNSWDDF